jgi:hypothetical protein
MNGGEYHKIQSVFLRDPATNHKTFLLGQYSMPEFHFLRDAEWVWTEKVDGTNVRIIWDGPARKVRFGGKTNDAQMPTFLLSVLQDQFTEEKLFAVFGENEATLYGEGYGAKIQKGGGNYLPDRAGFILFDAWCGMWLERPNVHDIANKLETKVIPILGVGPLQWAIDAVSGRKVKSIVAPIDMLAEGLVLRPRTELLTRRGERIITKLKVKDFPE